MQVSGFIPKPASQSGWVSGREKLSGASTGALSCSEETQALPGNGRPLGSSVVEDCWDRLPSSQYIPVHPSISQYTWGLADQLLQTAALFPSHGIRTPAQAFLPRLIGTWSCEAVNHRSLEQISFDIFVLTLLGAFN